MESVLLVEDEPLVSMVQADALTEAGYLVHPALDGASALAVARAVGLSAAIIDMGLPDCSGDYVARELRIRHPTLPILICTGYDATALEGVTKDLGVRIVEKPIDESGLIATLREHMRKAAEIESPRGTVA